MVRNSLLSLKIYSVVCRWKSSTGRKSSHFALEIRAVTSVSMCLYKFDQFFALLNLNIFVYFRILCVILRSPGCFSEFIFSFENFCLLC